MIPRPPAVLLPLVAALLLSSCLDYNEEMTLHSDLSGEATVTITLPGALMSKYDNVNSAFDKDKIEKRFASASGVSLLSYDKTEGRQPVVTLRIKFSSLEKLDEAISANPPAAAVAGRFTVTREGSLTKIERKLGMGDLGSDLPEYNEIKFKTHYDAEITNTNSPQYNSPASDIRYRYRLTEMLAVQPTQLTVLAQGLPWKVILLSLAIIGGGAWYGYQYFGKKKPGPVSVPPSPESPPAGAPPRPGPAQPRRPGHPPSPNPPQK